MRKMIVVIVAVAFAVLAGCKEKSAPAPAPETASSSASTPAPAAAPKTAAATTASPSATLPTGDNLLAASAGVAVVVHPSEYSDDWSAGRILDGDPETGWASVKGQTTGQVIVIESPEKIELDSIVFDTRKIDGDGRGAKDVTIAVSDKGRTDGFVDVGKVALDERKEEAFAISNPMPGRWVRLTVADNHGAPDYSEIMDVRGYGKKLTDILDQPSLTSFSAGATIAQKPSEYSQGWSALMMLDENPKTGWASQKGDLTNQSTVIALPTRTELSYLVFDTANIDHDGRGANHVKVEMSDTSADAGFQEIANVQLDDHRDTQLFPVSSNVPGRWMRVIVADNHGDPNYTELMEIRGMGRQLEPPASIEISGTYKTNYGNMHLKQEGTSITGCYESGGLITGGIEGRVMKVDWREPKQSGPAIMVFSPDGKRLNGLWWHEGQTSGSPGFWDGEKTSDEIGRCANWAGGAEAQLEQDLEKSGRAVVYGINFDVDSDVIRGESKPTLDKIVAVLRAHPGWKLTIEGHTDSTGGAEHNQELSERRAASVKAYLVAAGIDGSRLTTAGFGASRPVATNDTALGRAQNRRVELRKD